MLIYYLIYHYYHLYEEKNRDYRVMYKLIQQDWFAWWFFCLVLCFVVWSQKYSVVNRWYLFLKQPLMHHLHEFSVFLFVLFRDPWLFKSSFSAACVKTVTVNSSNSSFPFLLLFRWARSVVCNRNWDFGSGNERRAVSSSASSIMMTIAGYEFDRLSRWWVTRWDKQGREGVEIVSGSFGAIRMRMIIT